MTPLDLIAAHPWKRAVFTSYALSLAFFEAVVLDSLVRGGSNGALIIADVEGVRASLNEQGARRAGRDYEVEPIKATRGLFHPKVTVLSAKDEAHMLIGSGNLTFGGWGANLEVVEHLHPSFAADSFEDAADFFENIASSSHLRHGITETCGGIAEELRIKAATGRKTGRIRLVHSMDSSIADRLIEMADELGGAIRLVIASPFWDDGEALDGLCRGLGLDHAFVHAHDLIVEGMVGANWPCSPRVRVNAVKVMPLEQEPPRRLHAKMFEVLCRRGRIVLSGSANATGAALTAGLNVEACIARIQRDRMVGWTLRPATRPEPMGLIADASDVPTETSGVLRATLDGERISAQVLWPKLNGPAEVFQLSSGLPEFLAATEIDYDGCFRLDAPGLELEAWKSRRLTIRVVAADGRFADGFISVSAFAELTRRAGLMAPRLFAFLGGSETPADFAALLSWLQEDPDRLGLSIGSGSAYADKSPLYSDARVPISELTSAFSENRAGTRSNNPGVAAWERLMAHLLASFSKPRGPFPGTSAGHEDDFDDDAETAREENPPDPGIERAFVAFQRFFQDWLSPQKVAAAGHVVFGATIYVCDRLGPEVEQAQAWFEHLVDVIPRSDQTDNQRYEYAAVILALFNRKKSPASARRARERLLRFGVDLSGPPPEDDCVQSATSALNLYKGFGDLWADVQKVRTIGEQALTYIHAFNERKNSSEYPDFASNCKEEWPTLLDALTNERSRGRILFVGLGAKSCPRCHSVLPNAEIHKLRLNYAATARNCCSSVLVAGGY